MTHDTQVATAYGINLDMIPRDCLASATDSCEICDSSQLHRPSATHVAQARRINHDDVYLISTCYPAIIGNFSANSAAAAADAAPDNSWGWRREAAMESSWPENILHRGIR